MRKYSIIYIVCILFLALSGNTVLADSSFSQGDQDVTLLDSFIDGSEDINDFKIVSDNYGGNLYYFKDAEGNQCASNNMEFSFSLDDPNVTLAESYLEDKEGISDLKIVSDNYGGNLYYYRDVMGNQCVSNSVDRINSQIRLAQADTSSSNYESETEFSDDDAYDDFDDFDDEFDFDIEEPHVSISDPLEPINRAFFHFNDKLYFWVLKPAATGYKAVVPSVARRGIRNFFKNLSFPVRFINCILQFKLNGAVQELGKFVLNSTLGVGGLYNIAEEHFEFTEFDEDFGQTLGSYGIGHGFYIHWPFLGPSSVTDTIGTVGDAFLEPLHYLEVKTKYDIAIKGVEQVNSTSFTLGEIEDLKKAALDPYIAARDAYYQYRQNKIEK